MPSRQTCAVKQRYLKALELDPKDALTTRPPPREDDGPCHAGRLPGHLCGPAQHEDGPVGQDPGGQGGLTRRLTPTSEPSYGLPAGSEPFYSPSTGAESTGSCASLPLAPGQLASQPLASQLLASLLLAVTLASGPSSLEPSTVDQSGPVLGNVRSPTPLIKRVAVSKVLETAE